MLMIRSIITAIKNKLMVAGSNLFPVPKINNIVINNCPNHNFQKAILLLKTEIPKVYLIAYERP